MKTPNLYLKAITLFLATSQLTQATTCSEGGSCGGGGNTVGNETVDSYLDRHKKENQEIRKEVEPVLAALRSKLPELTQELELGIEKLDWYFIDRPLTALPLTRTELPFDTNQTAVQIGSSAYIHKESFERLSAEEKQKLLVHELARRIQLEGEGTNVLLTPSSAIKATNLIMKAAKKEISISNFKDQLENIGFNAEPQLAFFSGEQKKEVNRKPAFADPIEIPISIDRPITLKEAREAVSYCMGTGMGNANTRALTLAGQILFPQLGKLPKVIFEQKTLKEESNPSEMNQDENIFYCGQQYEDKTNPSLSPIKLSCRIMGKKIGGGRSSIAEIQIGIDKWAGPSYGNTSENDVFFSFQNRNGKYVSVPGASFSGNLPRVNYQAQAGEKLLTEWGLTNEDMLLDRFSITMEKDQYHGDYVNLVNRKTKATLPVRIWSRGYAECLRGSIEEKSRIKKIEEERELAREVNRGKALKFAPSESRSQDSDGSSNANDVK
jgi:hypothetical protein